MKKHFANFVMPLAAITMAVGGAFAGTYSGQKDGAVVDRIGYIKNGIDCIQTSVLCSTDSQQPMCKDSAGNILYDFNGTTCPLHLYQRVNP